MTASGAGGADKQGKCSSFISMILREKICINPICTKPRLRGCMIAGLDRASPFLGNLRGRSVLLLLLHTPVRQAPTTSPQVLVWGLRQGRRFLLIFPAALLTRGPDFLMVQEAGG